MAKQIGRPRKEIVVQYQITTNEVECIDYVNSKEEKFFIFVK